MPKWAILANWQIGPTKAFEPNDEVIQWILDAIWFNWNYQHRIEITRDIEACNVIWLTPMRLGVQMAFISHYNGEKRHANIFIRLYDTRIITPDLFRIQTYKEWFTNFIQDLEDSGTYNIAEIIHFHILKTIFKIQILNMKPTPILNMKLAPMMLKWRNKEF